jgi:cell wall-associated NlpC family hydrolase
MHDARPAIVHWAQWMVTQRARCTYSEGSQRMSSVHRRGVLPFVSDCSGFVTAMYAWANAPDPNGLNFDGEGYTGTELNHGQHLALWTRNGQNTDLKDILPGDVVVYGPGTGWHTALIIEGGPNPLTVSMGQNGDPSYVRVAQDGRLPQTYLRFNTKTRKVISPQSFLHLPPHYQRP